MAAVTGDRVAVCLFAKPPRPGQAKTRLAAALGDAVAARLAQAFIADTWALICSLEWADPILATTDVGDPFWQTLPEAAPWPQGDGDLGARMERVLRRAHETHETAMIVGSDVPGLPASALTQARAALGGSDFVIGPADDGGYYLIGCRRPCPPDVFSGVVWSTSTTRAQTEARLRMLGRGVLQVTPWFDVDDVSDLDRLCRLGARLRDAAPATARVIESMALSDFST